MFGGPLTGGRKPTSRDHTMTQQRIERVPAASLSLLAHRVTLARREVETERRKAGRQPMTQNLALRHLLSCLEAYASGLSARHLPIPPALRDELRLRRGL